MIKKALHSLQTLILGMLKPEVNTFILVMAPAGIVGSVA